MSNLNKLSWSESNAYLPIDPEDNFEKLIFLIFSEIRERRRNFYIDIEKLKNYLIMVLDGIDSSEVVDYIFTSPKEFARETARGYLEHYEEE